MTYLATFDRISRNHNVAPLTVSGDADAIAEQIYRYAKPKVASRDVEVVVDLEEMKGHIFCGMQVGGSFTLTEAPVLDEEAGQ
jgi:hypothetical protein